MPDEEDEHPCSCCGVLGGRHTAECVVNQPDEYVIDDGNPGVLRAPRPDDYVGGRFPWDMAYRAGLAEGRRQLDAAMTLGESDGYTRAILGAQEDVNALAEDLADVRRELDGVHAELDRLGVPRNPDEPARLRVLRALLRVRYAPRR